MSRRFVMPRRYGGMPIDDFDALCRRIVKALAVNNRQFLASGVVDVHKKASYAGVAAADVFTVADKSSEALFAELACEFPQSIGYIGEEGLRRPCTLGDCDIYITIDPLDGTRMYITALNEGRQLRPGEVSAMLGVLVGPKNEPSMLKSVAGYVCDVADDTLYSLSPNGSCVEVTKGLNIVDSVKLQTARRANTGYLAIHKSQSPSAVDFVADGEVARLLTTSAKDGGIFGNVGVEFGSVGLRVANVFNGQYSALLRPNCQSFCTPWDEAPLQAFCRMGNAKTFAILPDRLQEVVIADGVINKISRREHDILYLPLNFLREVKRKGIEVVTL